MLRTWSGYHWQQQNFPIVSWTNIFHSLLSTRSIKQLKLVHMCFPGTWNLHFPNVGMMSKHSDSVHASKKASLVSSEHGTKMRIHIKYIYFFPSSADLLHFSGQANWLNKSPPKVVEKTAWLIAKQNWQKCSYYYGLYRNVHIQSAWQTLN